MICHVTPTIMDGIVVRWNPNPEFAHVEEISASRNGVLVGGWSMLRVERQRDEFNATVSLAWEMYRLLAKAAERGPFVRMETDDVRTWLKERGQRVVDVHFGESLADAVSRAEGKRRDDDVPMKCCPRFTWGDGTHDLSCRGDAKERSDG